MPQNIGSTFTIKSNNGSMVPLYPNTIDKQVMNEAFGEEFGPYPVTLPVGNWVNRQQTVDMPGITSQDIPICLKVLSGTIDEMKAQDAGYTLLDPLIGIESLQGQVRFTLRSTTNKLPRVDLNVVVSWNR